MDGMMIIETHGDPLGAVRTFLNVAWRIWGIDLFLVPTNGTAGVKKKPISSHRQNA